MRLPCTIDGSSEHDLLIKIDSHASFHAIATPETLQRARATAGCVDTFGGCTQRTDNMPTDRWHQGSQKRRCRLRCDCGFTSHRCRLAGGQPSLAMIRLEDDVESREIDPRLGCQISQPRNKNYWAEACLCRSVPGGRLQRIKNLAGGTQ